MEGMYVTYNASYDCYVLHDAAGNCVDSNRFAEYFTLQGYPVITMAPGNA